MTDGQVFMALTAGILLGWVIVLACWHWLVDWTQRRADVRWARRTGRELVTYADGVREWRPTAADRQAVERWLARRLEP